MKTKPLHALVPAIRSIALLAIPWIITLPMARGDGVVQQWTRNYDNPDHGNDVAGGLAVDGSGNVVVTGYSDHGGYNGDFYTAKYRANDGALLWERRYDNPNHFEDYANAIAVDASGNVIVTGQSTGGSSSGLDFYTAKYGAANGALLWERHYPGPGNSTDVANAVAVDSNGDVVVTGRSGGDFYTAKYSGADGTLLWEQRSLKATLNTDTPNAVAVDSAGNAFVTGYSYNASSTADFYTAKYAAGDGALLWEKRYNGPANSDDRANALAVDGNGNVVVTGYTTDASGKTDFYTAKYAAEDGALIWERGYNGPANRNDAAAAVAVDGAGHVLVTGYVRDANDTADFYTAKYAASDGALLWERSYNGPGNGNDAAAGVSVDGQGDVVVSGTSTGSSGIPGFYTAKYAAPNGALLWERRSEVAVLGAGEGQKQLALTPNGGVVFGGTVPNGKSDYLTVKYAPVETTTSGAQQLTPTVMDFYGSANPGGVATKVSFEWGTTPALGSVTPPVDIGSGTTAVQTVSQVSGLPAGATIYLRIRADSSEGSNYGRVLAFTNYIPLAHWKQLHLGNAQAPDLGDPDGDGLTTLAEYGLGLRPETPDKAPAATLFDYAEGRRLRMFVQRDPAHSNAVVEVQAGASPDGPWTTIALSNLGKPFAGPGYIGGDGPTPGVKTVEVRDFVNVADAGRRFMRVRVTH